MAIETILSQIDAEIARLTQIRTLLSNTDSVTKQATGAKAKTTAVKVKTKKTRVLSPDARKRIADAQRRRWAAYKAKTK
jgi:hypothetical protein